MTNWKTIDSAPIDGTEIDLWFPASSINNARREANVRWNKFDGFWKRRDRTSCIYAVKPTHWSLSVGPDDIPQVVSAKPLEWYKPTDHPQDRGIWTAHGFGGRYSIETDSVVGYLLWWAHDEFAREECSTETEAKQKAEADWQKRFLERIVS